MKKYTLKEIKKFWHFAYNEDLSKQYKGFFNLLKRKDKKKMQLTKQETLNLLDALTEWNDIIEPKELADNEIGLNADRYEKLIKKLKQQIKKKG